jgi:hypothetical protein
MLKPDHPGVSSSIRDRHRWSALKQMIKAVGATFGDMPTGLMSHGFFALQLAGGARIFPGRYEEP